ncbi:hypothetical protein H4R18_005025 [Coemansia javaensis]|uniref:GATA-type domain-containing protein n=1 Tax=Coemansia javaensis TaxID=2761396 RepID=A0A9W8H9Y4_9FUNG|nr:hypothetical protein H4R18_005025 [Coemansia javaensis]
MIVDARTVGETQYAGAVSLAHSLLRSRLAWVTSAFAALDPPDAAQPRQALGAAELQIGPFLFPETAFYRVGAPAAAAAAAPAAELRRRLALEFADNPGALFWLPPDLGVDGGARDGALSAYFFASPAWQGRPGQRPPDRRPPAIRRERPHYFPAERVLTRIDIAMAGVGRPLADALLEYAELQSVAVWREYRRALCQPRPAASYWFEYFPKQHRRPLLGAVRVPPDSPLAEPAPRDPLPPPPPPPPPSKAALPREQQQGAGGKGGYNMSVAMALLRKRKRLGPALGSGGDSEDGSSGSGSGSGSDGAEPAPEPCKPPPPRRGAAGGGRSCKYCGCSETPIWRRGPGGAGTLCNACGVKWKLGKILQ